MLKDIWNNPLLLVDAYNYSHEFLKCNVDFEVSHLYNRSAPMLLYGFQETVYNIFSNLQINLEMVDEAAKIADGMGLPFPHEMLFRLCKDLHGRFPLSIEAILDGTWVPRGTPFSQIRNTVVGYGELVTFFEGLLMHAYFPAACATRVLGADKYLKEQQKKYNYDDSFMWRFHSFGFRGHRSLTDAYWAATAWNLFLHGTDDVCGVKHTCGAVVGSISALAHKVTQQFNAEYGCYIHAIDATEKLGKKIVAIVIDTYDANRFIDKFSVPLAEYAKGKGITVVYRPDSGDVINQTIGIYTKCVQVHHLDNVKVIVGMDMSFEKAKIYDSQLLLAGVPLNFVSYGIGAGYYKDLERDTLGWSMKTAFSNAKPRMKFSNDPIKQSIPDIVDVIRNINKQMVVCRRSQRDDANPSLYKTLHYFNGDDVHCPEPVWKTIRDRAIVQDSSQEQIILSEGIQDLIKEIRTEHELG